MSVSAKVSVGPASVLGWLAAGAAFVSTGVQALQNSEALASGPGKWPAILGVAALLATNAGRQFQAAHLTKAAAIADTAAGVLPSLEQELAEPPATRPEAAVAPDGAVPLPPPAPVAPAPPAA